MDPCVIIGVCKSFALLYWENWRACFRVPPHQEEVIYVATIQPDVGGKDVIFQEQVHLLPCSHKSWLTMGKNEPPSKPLVFVKTQLKQK